MTKSKGILFLKGLLDSASDAIVGVNQKSEVVLFNKQAERILGYTEDEILGKSVLRLFPARYRKVISTFSHHYYTKSHNKLIATNRVFLGLRKNGEEFPVNFSLSEFNSGNTNLVVCSFRDTTEFENAKSLLKESEAKYRQIVEGSHELIQSISATGKMLYVNRAWKKTLGYTDEDIKNLTFWDILSDESKATCEEKFARVMKGETVHGIEFVFIAKSGRKVYTEGNSTPQFEGGKVISTQGFFRDITESKLAGYALKESKANLGALFQSSAIGYLMLNTQMEIVAYNRIMSHWVVDETGLELKEGVNYTHLLSGERRIRATDAFVRALKGESIEYEASGDDNKQKRYWFYISINPVQQDDGKIIGLSVTCLDITGKKKTELQMRNMTNDIIQRNKDLEQFAYIVSHNLRSPLSNIMGAANVMQYEDISENDKERLLEGIYTSVKKLDDVVLDLNNILQVNRTISENKQTVNLTSLVEDIRLSISNLMTTERVALTTDFTEANALFSLKSYIHSIFYNLITNSIKYRKPDVPPEIAIKSHKVGNGVVITFTDNGLGIDTDKHKDRIFGLYKRFHENTEGKGLGLFMVKTQVETLGGKISIKSKVNNGTEFTIFFEN